MGRRPFDLRAVVAGERGVVIRVWVTMDGLMGWDRQVRWVWRRSRERLEGLEESRAVGTRSRSDSK